MKFKTGSGGSNNLIYISNKYVFKCSIWKEKTIWKNKKK